MRSRIQRATATRADAASAFCSLLFTSSSRCFILGQVNRLKFIPAAVQVEKIFETWIGGSILASLVSFCMVVVSFSSISLPGLFSANVDLQRGVRREWQRKRRSPLSIAYLCC